MIINELTKDGIRVKDLKLGSNKLVKVKCDQCGSLMGREKTGNWIKYNKISNKDQHICKSCTTRKQFGYETPKEKEIDGVIYRHCNKCGQYKLKKDFWAGEGKICKKCDKERHSHYYETNKEIIKQRTSEWSKNNKEKVKSIKDNFNKADPQRLKDYQKKWEQSPKGKAYNHTKRIKKKALMENYRAITPEDVTNLKQEIIDNLGKYICPYCGDEMNTGEYKKTESIEHMIPRIRGPEYPEYDINNYNNLTYCCLSCNSSKDHRLITEFKEVPFLIKKFRLLKKYPDNIMDYRKKHFKLFDTEEREEFVEKVFSYYRTHGFPYYNYSKEERLKIFRRLKDFDINDIDEGDSIGWTGTAGGLASYYHPHMFEIETRDSNITPIKNFNNDKTFRSIIHRRIKSGDDILPYGMRKALNMFSVQGVSNFRTTVAKYMYEKYGNKGDVLDFSSGFSGRLIGAMASDITSYTGIEPAQKTYQGLLNTYEDLKEHSATKCQLYNICAEDYFSPDTKYDFIFSSPPYFDLEKYSKEPNQSYIKYDTYEKWLEKFLEKVFSNCREMLKPNGIFAINIANTPKHPLYDDTLNLCLKYFNIIEIKKMKLSSLSKNYKIEPIIILKNK